MSVTARGKCRLRFIVNGEDAFENSDVSDAKEGLNAGDTLTFTVWRDGRTLDITVILMDPADMGK